MNAPAFAVVGHPNKGKSSLVATLSRDARVRIAAQPGTTRAAHAYPMRVDGEVLYTLIDTPGFQRARRVLEWLREHADSASERPAAVRRFVAEHRDDPDFHDECELLTPIIEGAGIIYVVDGAVPYAAEYEAEMEILRWTGQPSMAVINPIGEAVFREDWERALGQYFRIVRVVDALAASFERRLQLLAAFGELDERWREPLARAVTALRAERDECVHGAAAIIAAMLAAALALVEHVTLADGEDERAAERRLQARYRERLRELEREAREAVQALYHHHGVERTEQALELLDDDLFAERSWQLFGLSRGELAGAAAVGGAAAGAGVDVLAGGASMLLGAAIGAVASGALAWFGGERLAEVAHESGHFGEQVLRVGPARGINLGFVLLGRARYHHAAVAGRTHARRDALAPGPAEPPPLSDAERRELARLFEKLRRREAGDAGSAGRELAALLGTLLAADLSATTEPGA